MYIPYTDGKNNLKDIISLYIQELRMFYSSHPYVKFSDCLWVTIRNNRFINSRIGINSLGSMPSKIAELLQLQNSSNYTGHCFRRSAASCMAANGSTEEEIMAVGRWHSEKVAHRYVQLSGNTRWNAVQGMISGYNHRDPVV